MVVVPEPTSKKLLDVEILNVGSTRNCLSIASSIQKKLKCKISLPGITKGLIGCC